MSTATAHTVPALAALRAEFAGGEGYLAACTAGLPMWSTREVVAADLTRWPDLGRYTRAAEESRAHAARLLGVAADRIAIGSHTSVMAGMLAASLPDGAEVLCAADEFSSIVLPFVHAGRGITVRTAPLTDLAAAVGPGTHLVVFSLVQSACGTVADGVAIAAAARAHGARTLCDVTQAAGWMPVAGTLFDAVVCHAYKWLCAPRGVAFLALSEEYARTVRPIHAGWYAGEDPWASCYGGDAVLAGDARRFDVSPAWQAFLGAEPALRAFAGADIPAIAAHVTALASAFRERCDLPAAPGAVPSAIVSWPDPDGRDLARLTDAGIAASGRNGRARLAFHVFNDHGDVDRAACALGR